MKPAALAVVAVLAVLSGSPESARAQWPNGIHVDETPHNLMIPAKNTDPDMVNQIADYDQACVYCHMPHGGSSTGYIWNRPTPSGPFRMFDGTQMLQDPQPTGNSLACLSCHDGTIGLDQILVPPKLFSGPGPWGVMIDDCEGCHSGGNPDGGIDWEGVWLDTDLRGQHPISLIYDPARASGFRSALEVEAAGLPLFQGRVQCMTCHDPHSQANRPFLRISNGGGNLCLTCHTSTPGEQTAHHW